ncbi:DUF6678 family protein [Myxococcota bacterium]
MTEEQNRDAGRLQRYIEREQLVSVMNDTKWRELQVVITEELSFRPRYRVKCLRGADDFYWDTDWHTHLPTFKEIEWLEIDPICKERQGRLVPDIATDKSAELESLLQSVSIPFERRDGLIRVYGYHRPTTV